MRAQLEVAGIKDLAVDLFGTDVKSGTVIEAPNSAASFTLEEYEESRGFGIEHVLQLTLEFSNSVAAHVVAIWLFEILSKYGKFVRFGGVSYRINLESLTKLVERIRSTRSK